MIALNFDTWSSSSGRFFVLTRIYWRCRWTPFCSVRKRYSTWLGFWRAS
jgi:hypothetical protein